MPVGNRVPYKKKHAATAAERQTWERHRASVMAEARTGLDVKETLASVRHPGWQWERRSRAGQRQRPRPLSLPPCAAPGAPERGVFSIPALSPPPLSSINLVCRRAGWEAAALLAVMMDGGKVAPDIHRIPPLGIVTRQSTDVLAVDDPTVARALRYIREHACEGIDVGDVLQHSPMSRRILEGKLKTLLGRTPREEIMRVQLNRAKDMLTGTELALAEIAERAGFQHTEYFSFVFKRENGVTPSAYRKEHGAQWQAESGKRKDEG